MNIEIGNKQFELKTNIGTIKKIEREFNRKSFIQVTNEIETMTVEDIQKLLLAGVDGKEEKEEFKEAMDTNAGFMDLFEYLKNFIGQLQYPGKTEKEIEKLNEKMVKETQGKN
jgi:hypothetical protein